MNPRAPTPKPGGRPMARWAALILVVPALCLLTASEGELAASRALGWLLAAGVVISAVLALRYHRRARSA